MTKPHRATPEQWDDAGAFASDTRACILELRARIEDLEDDALEQSRSQEFCLDHVIQRLEKLEAAQRAHIDREDLARPATFAELLMPPPRTTTPITRDRDGTGDYLIRRLAGRSGSRRTDGKHQREALWGTPTIQPVPVSERLPTMGADELDDQGTCWNYHPVNLHYCLCVPDPSVHTHWLPHHALPAP